MAAQWCGTGGLDGLMGRWWCSLSPVCPPPVPAVSSPSRRTRRRKGKVGCVSVPRELASAAAVDPTAPPEEAEADTEKEGVECDGCNGAGWLLCDFCKGKKNNVNSKESNRIYRRCPTCKAAGCIICPRCRVYKCITYPERNDS